MRLHFQEIPWNMYPVLGYAVVIKAVLLALIVGSLLATLLVLFVPCYVLVAALFPGSRTPEKPGLGREIRERTFAVAPRCSWGSGVRGSVCVYSGCLRGG